MVRCTSTDSRVWWKIGLARGSDLLIRNEASTCHRSWQLVRTFPAGINVAGMFVTYPFNPTRRRARDREAWSREVEARPQRVRRHRRCVVAC